MFEDERRKHRPDEEQTAFSQSDDFDMTVLHQPHAEQKPEIFHGKPDGPSEHEKAKMSPHKRPGPSTDDS